MYKNVLKYIKNFGIKLWLYQFLIVFLNKFGICKGLLKKMKISKNKQIESYLKNNFNFINKRKDEKKIISNKIWVFWWQGLDNAPVVVKKCIDSIKKYNKDKEIIIISKENVNTYYEIPEFIQEKLDSKIITLTHFSDILRFNLLKKYGGFWMDATIFFTDNYFSEKEFNLFKTPVRTTNDVTSISKGKWCGFFIGGPNIHFYNFMVDFFNEYWQKKDIIIDYFLIDYVISVGYSLDEEIRIRFDKVEKNSQDIHTLQNILNDKYDEEVCNKLLESTKVHKLSYKIYISDEDDTFYRRIVTASK